MIKVKFSDVPIGVAFYYLGYEVVKIREFITKYCIVVNAIVEGASMDFLSMHDDDIVEIYKNT